MATPETNWLCPLKPFLLLQLIGILKDDYHASLNWAEDLIFSAETILSVFIRCPPKIVLFIRLYPVCVCVRFAY